MALPVSLFLDALARCSRNLPPRLSPRRAVPSVHRDAKSNVRSDFAKCEKRVISNHG